MKNVKPFIAAGLIILAGLLVMSVAGCKKDTNNTPPPAISAVAFYNASPDASPLSIYLNTNQVQHDSLLYKGVIPYVSAYSGTREIIAYRNNVKEISKTVTLAEGKFYSVFLTGSYSTAQFALLDDSLANPPAGKTNIRFVNMSVGAPALDLALSTGTVVVSNREYKANSAFTSIDGGKQYSFVIREHGATVDKVVIPSVNLLTGHSYTIWTRGIYNGTGATALGADIVRNY